MKEGCLNLITQCLKGKGMLETAPAPESVKEENKTKLFLASCTLTTIWWLLSAAPETLTSLPLLSKQMLLSIMVITL